MLITCGEDLACSKRQAVNNSRLFEQLIEQFIKQLLKQLGVGVETFHLAQAQGPGPGPRPGLGPTGGKCFHPYPQLFE